jgi:hypothetical protein
MKILLTTGDVTVEVEVDDDTLKLTTGMGGVKSERTKPLSSKDGARVMRVIDLVMSILADDLVEKMRQPGAKANSSLVDLLDAIGITVVVA